MLELRHVKLVYEGFFGRNTTAIDNVSLQVEGGDKVGIYGPSGSGKSSLLYLLSGLRRPTAGSAFYNGQDYAEMSEAEKLELRRLEFGFIFQDHFLINHLTVTENILVPVGQMTDQINKRLSELMSFLGIEGLKRQFPFELSGGQRQRVSIARALINNPSVIFADEPTASLDRKAADRVLDLLSQYHSNNNTTLIVVSHDELTLAHFDRKVELTIGKLVETSHA